MTYPATARFVAFYEWTGLSQSALAKQLGCSACMVSRVLAGQRRVSIELATAIEDASKNWPQGAIKVREWSHRAAKKR